jgi:5-deoxy-glucuronate isomerase
MQLRFQASGRLGYEAIIKDHPALSYIEEFGVLCLSGEVIFVEHTGAHEALLHQIEGSCAIDVEGQPLAELDGRASPFNGRPSAVYLPPQTHFRIRPLRGRPAEVTISYAVAAEGGEPVVIRPDHTSGNEVGQDNWRRQVTMIAPPDFPSQRLILGETVNPSGNWSGVPTHKHDTYQPGQESVHEELYYFRADHPGAWGVERIYDKNGLDELVLLQDRVVVIMPRGYHTVTAAPGSTLYYAFVMAGPEKQIITWLDPNQAWIAQNARR